MRRGLPRNQFPSPHMDVLSHWIHIVFAAVALGGLLYGGFVLGPSMSVLADADRAALAERLATRFRPIALTALALLLISGSYNLFRAIERGADASYHMAFGIKFLLALHVLGMLFFVSTPPSGDPAKDAKRPRLMIGGAISALIVFALGAYLRSLHN